MVMNRKTSAPTCLAALLWAACAAGLSLLSGCGGREYAEVTGTITLDGEPLGDAEVQFLPDPDKGNSGPTATAFTDKEGYYRLRCDKLAKDGTVLGPHRVCILDITVFGPRPGFGPRGFKPKRPPSPPGTRPVASAKPKVSRVPPEYADPVKTPFRDVEVKSGTQVLNFNVTSGKWK
jgi:hypothetical protein